MSILTIKLLRFIDIVNILDSPHLGLVWLPYDKRKCEQKVARLVWYFDCLHFAQYILISPHGIDCKQTRCKKIYRMDRLSWLKPLYWHLKFSVFTLIFSIASSHFLWFQLSMMTVIQAAWFQAFFSAKKRSKTKTLKCSELTLVEDGRGVSSGLSYF